MTKKVIEGTKQKQEKQPEKEKNLISRLWNNITLKLIFINTFVTVAMTLIFYPLIPRVLNYPPNNETVSAALGTSNFMQYVLICGYSCIFLTLYLVLSLRKFKGWENLDVGNEDDNKKIKIIRKKCINIPFNIYFLQLTTVNLPLILMGIIVSTLNNTQQAAVFKVILMTLSMFSIVAVVMYVFSKRIFNQVLIKTYNKEKHDGSRTNLRKGIFIQLLPLLVFTIIFTALIGYSRVISEKGDMIYNSYKNMLSETENSFKEVKTAEQALSILKKSKFPDSKPVYFVKSPNGSTTEIKDNKIIEVTSDEKTLGGYFAYYIKNPYNDDRMFDINAESQGIVKTVTGADGQWKIGVIFQVASDNTILVLIFSSFVLLLLTSVVLYYFANNISGDITLVAKNLMEIANGVDVDFGKKIAVTSNDEIADLVISFNRIQQREEQHINELKEQQAIIIEQERLASLGQLVGGIAHNLRTPIMSLSGAIEGLKDLVKEYAASVGDDKVSMADHREIARDMTEWLGKMGPYCSYMSDIITAVKDQTIQHSATEDLAFSVIELVERVELLMSNELKRNCCTLKVDCRVEPDTMIPGDMSILTQVLNNLITNAIQSYDKTGQEIEFIIKENEKRIDFIIRDYGSGISDEVKEKLFKEMVTTKGKQGTGLGLFISHSSIKAHFKGDIWFESTYGEGTTFHVSIPVESTDGNNFENEDENLKV